MFPAVNHRNITPIICKLHSESAGSIAELEKFYQAVPWSLKLISDELVEPTSTSLGARILGDLCGYVSYRTVQNEAHILNLCVSEDYRRGGVASLLLSKSFELMRERATEWCSLEVRVTNLKAKKLYEKFGFFEVGVRKGYYRNNKEDALILKMNITKFFDSIPKENL